MSVIFILVIASLFIAGGFLAAFIWSVKDGQYEDDYTPSVRILFEEGNENKIKKEEKNNNPNPWSYKNSTTTTRQ